jgi:hypothetical protein
VSDENKVWAGGIWSCHSVTHIPVDTHDTVAVIITTICHVTVPHCRVGESNCHITFDLSCHKSSPYLVILGALQVLWVAYLPYQVIFVSYLTNFWGHGVTWGCYNYDGYSIAAQVRGMLWCAEIHYHTHSCDTCDQITMGFPIPLPNPICN